MARPKTHSLPISKADAAREKGVTKGAVSLAVRPGGPLHAALLDTGRIDSAHPAYRAWLGREPADRAPTASPKAARSAPSAPTPPKKSSPAKADKPTAGRPGPVPKEAPTPAPEQMPAIPRATAKELAHIRGVLKPLVDRFGTYRVMKEWLEALKSIEIILEKHLGNEEAQGRLIERELVRTHVFGAINALARKLLQDAPKTIARRLAGHFNAKGTIEEAERMVRENLSAQITPVKAKAARVLREVT
jgi:hypothetical protein